MALLRRFATNMIDGLPRGNSQKEPPKLVAGRDILKSALRNSAENTAEHAEGDVFLVTNPSRRRPEPLLRNA
jgi:hypothetical protein